MKLTRGAIWLKGDAPVSQRAIAGVLPDQRIGLKPTRVGDDGPLPATHLVQPAQRSYGGRTWTLHEVKCIHDDGLDAACRREHPLRESVLNRNAQTCWTSPSP